MRPRIRSALLALLLALGLVPLVDSPVHAVATASQVVVGVTGYGTVTTSNGGPTCASSPANPDSTETDCAGYDPAPYHQCTSDGSGDTICSVVLTATPTDPAGWSFSGWSGDCSGSSTTCRVTTSEHQCDTINGKPFCTDSYYDVKAVAHFVDDRPPTPVFTLAPDTDSVVYSAFASQTFHFTTDEPDEGITYRCASDLAPYVACGSGFTWPSISDGVHTFCVRATDASGQFAVEAACRTWEQEAPPSATIITHPDAQTGVAGPVGFTYASNKDGHPADGSTRWYRCSLDGAAYADCPASGKGYSAVANGTHTFSVAVEFHGVDDPRGTVHSGWTSYTWTQSDNTAPAVTWTTPGGVTATPPRQVSWTSDDTSATFRCGLEPTDGGPTSLAPCTSPYTLPALGLGRHTLLVEARDPVGNQTTARWSVDVEQPPACSIRLKSRRVVRKRATVIVSCSTAASGSVVGALSVRKPHRRPRALATRPAAVSLPAGSAVVVAVRLTPYEVKALRHHWRVRGSFRIVGNGPGGSSTASTPVTRLK